MHGALKRFHAHQRRGEQGSSHTQMVTSSIVHVSCFAGNKQNQHIFIPDGLIVSILYDTFQLETSNYEGSMVIVVTVRLHLVINLRSHILRHCLICMPSCRAVRASHYKERVLN